MKEYGFIVEHVVAAAEAELAPGVSPFHLSPLDRNRKKGTLEPRATVILHMLASSASHLSTRLRF